jgi:L-ascorbate metabolism protein UlaG (beta-lactamase superfamily)
MSLRNRPGLIFIVAALISGVVVMNFIQSAAMREHVVRPAFQSISEENFDSVDSIEKNMKTSVNMSARDFASSTIEFFMGGKDRVPKTELPVKGVDLSLFTSRKNDVLNVSWIGHSSLMINIDGHRILTDPVFARRVSIAGPTRFNGDAPVDIDDVPEVDAVVISHDHYDHLNRYSVQRLSARTARFVVPAGVAARLVKWGIPEKKIVELSWWESFSFDSRLKMISTPVQHFSGRGLFDRNKTLAASWIIQTPEHNIFFSGDSGYFPGFREIGDSYGPFDMTFIECGAYNKAWSTVHMFPEQTVQAHLDLRGGVLHPIHWATFNLSTHPWYEPMERLTEAAVAAGVSIATPVIGDTTQLGRYVPNTRWWNQKSKNLGSFINHSALNSSH